MSRLLVALFVLGLFTAPAFAQELGIAGADTAQSVIAAQKGKRITLRLRSGQELTGVVRDANAKLVVLGALQGREFFDAAIPLDSVEAVLVRIKQ